MVERKDRGRNFQINRVQTALDLLFQTKFGLTIGELHSQLVDRGFDVHKREVYRDIEGFQAKHYPLEQVSRGKGGIRWKLMSKVGLNKILPVSPNAVSGFSVLKGLSNSLEKSPLGKDLPSVFQSIEDKLDSKAAEHSKELQTYLKFSQHLQFATKVDPDILATIQAACSERHVIEAIYESANSGKRKRRLGPHALYFDRGSLYLVAEDLESETIKTFAVARFQSALMSDDPYEKAVVDIKQLFNNHFGVYTGIDAEKVVLIFDADVAAHISETVWHSSQSSEALADGRLKLTLVVGQTPDFVGWVLGFGVSVYVQEPRSLQERIEEVARSLQKRYCSK